MKTELKTQNQYLFSEDTYIVRSIINDLKITIDYKKEDFYDITKQNSLIVIIIFTFEYYFNKIDWQKIKSKEITEEERMNYILFTNYEDILYHLFLNYHKQNKMIEESTNIYNSLIKFCSLHRPNN